MNYYRNRHFARRRPFSKSRPFSKNRQRGVVLFMSLVMLLILTILGLSSVQTTSLQERMSRNARDTNLAFQAAESALRDGEDLIELLTSLAPFDNATAGYYRENAPGVVPNWKDVNATAAGNVNWEASSEAACGCMDANLAVTGVASQPRYIVEHVRAVISGADALNLDNIGQDTGSGRTEMFKITTYGQGGSASARVMLQSTYGKRI